VPNAFSAPDQLQRWQDSVTTLLREGLFLRPDDDSAGDPSR
ncbi:MAG: hypothetical protein QOJ80_2733, partial [Mycobacterium sp.]|nr:hypothetical protein [Mycobacterium sp.]